MKKGWLAMLMVMVLSSTGANAMSIDTSRRWAYIGDTATTDISWAYNDESIYLSKVTPKFLNTQSTLYRYDIASGEIEKLETYYMKRIGEMELLGNTLFVERYSTFFTYAPREEKKAYTISVEDGSKYALEEILFEGKPINGRIQRYGDDVFIETRDAMYVANESESATIAHKFNERSSSATYTVVTYPSGDAYIYQPSTRKHSLMVAKERIQDYDGYSQIWVGDTEYCIRRSGIYARKIEQNASEDFQLPKLIIPLHECGTYLWYSNGYFYCFVGDNSLVEHELSTGKQKTYDLELSKNMCIINGIVYRIDREHETITAISLESGEEKTVEIR